MDFAPNVERWRSAVERYAPSQYVDKVLWIINYESGGEPTAVGDGGRAIGLLQIQDNVAFPNRPTANQLLDPEFNIRYAVEQLGIAQGDFSAWGEGATYNGKPFGALGNHPFPYSTGNGTTTGGSGGSNTVGFNPPVPLFGGIPFVPGLGDIVDATGKAIDLVPGGHYVTDAVGNVFDETGKQVGKLNDAARKKIPGVGAVEDLASGIATLAGLFNKLPDVLIGLTKMFSWMLDPHHWFRLFFIGAGAGLIVMGGYIYVRGDKAIDDIKSAGSQAAKLGAAGAAA